MLEANISTQLKGYLANLQHEIVLASSLDNSAKSVELAELLNEIASMSSLVTLIQSDDSSERTPSFAVTRPGESASVRFAGLPLGHEFTSLVLALLHIGGHPMKLDDDMIAQVKAIEGEFHFETYISLSCQNCPDVVQALNMMSVLNSGISHVMIDGGLYPDEIETRQIMSVPTVYFNGEVFGQGRMTLPEIVAKLDSGADQKAAEKINKKNPFDVLIIGGGPAASAAAIYASRKGIRTGIVSERFGGQLNDTLAIENFISVQETEGPKLASAIEQQVKSYDVDIMELQRAKTMSSNGDQITVELENGASLQSQSVIISTGANWRELGIPGEEQYRGHGVAYCPHCDGPLYKGKDVAVVGGGNSGVEAAIDLAGLVNHVTLLEYADELKADAILQTKLATLSNVTVNTSAQSTEVLGDDSKVTGLVYIDRTSGDEKNIDLAGIFVQIGLLPNTDWLKGIVDLSEYGEVEVDDHARTSMEGVFAAGDVTTTPYKQITIAMGDGAKAALSAFDYLIRQEN
ncbi:MAG: alkyl hydroperoxide reductase subunit F [Gammaproteobacteria bacterium]|jgi:alkyl hydroperoxide reductase subunit F|nr:alkyl hydroperoxide reductase subunit F [Gammaproteobacteria bacterium]